MSRQELMMSLRLLVPHLVTGAAMLASAGLGGLVAYLIGKNAGYRSAPEELKARWRSEQAERIRMSEALDGANRVIDHQAMTIQSLISGRGEVEWRGMRIKVSAAASEDEVVFKDSTTGERLGKIINLKVPRR